MKRADRQQSEAEQRREKERNGKGERVIIAYISDLGSLNK
jgi:hypothetical protein